MKDPGNKDAINQIKEILQTYEEPYLDGAWEDFSKKQEKSALPYWRWSAVAALILLIGSVWLFAPKQLENNARKQVSTRKFKVLPEIQHHIDTSIGNLKEIPQMQHQKLATNHLNIKSRMRIIIPCDGGNSILVESNVNPAPRLSNAQVQVAELKADLEKPLPPANDRFMDFLVEQKDDKVKGNISNVTAKASSGSKWDFGIEILPTVSDAALNIGAGLTTQYKLSEHFAFGSGISFVELQAGKSLTPGVSLLSTRQLQSVDANFRGIDIPLNVVYNINKNLYTAVGVSYFNVISEDRKDTFVSDRQVSASATDPSTGLAANTLRIVSETSQEPATETLLNGKSYLGFFNFSVGRKQELFKKYKIFIEPFIKVPVGKLSQQDLKMTNGGMKFKLSF